jgi:nicotinamidase-related amidase
MSKALIVVDVQNDFLPGGALAVPEGDEILPRVYDLATSEIYEVVAYTSDWHPPDHCSFSENPEFRDGSWPVHCVKHTPGALPPELMLSGRMATWSNATVLEVRKGYEQDKEAYSGFEGTVTAEAESIPRLMAMFSLSSKPEHKGWNLEDTFNDLGVTDVDVVGLATDYCVFNTAVHSQERGFRTTVLLDACRGVSPETTDRAIEEMLLHNVKVSP